MAGTPPDPKRDPRKEVKDRRQAAEQDIDMEAAGDREAEREQHRRAERNEALGGVAQGPYSVPLIDTRGDADPLEGEDEVPEDAG